MNASGELTADFALPRAVVISGRAVERGTGRPMLATQGTGCHGQGPVTGGRVWYRPLAGNAAVTGNEAEGYYRHRLVDLQGQFLGLVESNGVFRGVVPPGLGVLLLEASPGMPFMWEWSLPWKESDGYHRRFPYAPLTRREPADGAPHVPGEARHAARSIRADRARGRGRLQGNRSGRQRNPIQGRDHHPDRTGAPGPLR